MPRAVHFLPEGALVFATAGDSGLHAHRAVQLLLAPAAPVRVTTDLADDPACHFIALPPQAPHRVQGAGQPLIHLFLDPGPAAWRAWIAAGGEVRPPLATLTARLQRAADSALDEVEARALLVEWREACLPGLKATPPPDPRIAAAVALIDADPTAADLDHRTLAARVHLSASRFLALFPQHTGMPVSHYRRWRQLLLAVALLRQGASVTDAAHAAGFADGPHLSRSVRRVLGSSPSEIRLPGADR
ncbi:MAG: helix-turn-helix domain-containing protein [Xanthomonadales bacterium]|jgi:AraC-like DNA-binding protein|nr:helix-turn-helix domain-containing protein [Xanthomonadales bacterium]